jgi:hypothetical protein
LAQQFPGAMFTNYFYFHVFSGEISANQTELDEIVKTERNINLKPPSFVFFLISR